MTLIRWEPFRETEEFMNRLMPSLLRGGLRAGPEGSSLPAVQWTPSADISETENEYLIRAEMPAVKKEDVKVSVQDGILAVEGERRQEKEEKGRKFHRIERSYGKFVRRLALPTDVDQQKVAAEFKDGVLSVHLPKSAAAKPRSIDVSVS